MIIRRTVILLAALAAGLLVPSPARPEQDSYVMPTAGPMTFSQFNADHLNPALRSLAGCNSGGSPPANGPGGSPVTFQCWWDSSTNPALLKYFDGSQWVTLASLDTSAHSFNVAISSPVNLQTGTSYTIVDGDRIRLVDLCNVSPVAVSIGQAGTGGLFVSGWFTYLRNSCVGTVTLTPTVSQVDGAASFVLRSNQSTVLRSDGTNYKTAFVFLAPANNLSDLGSAATARTNLGVAIGSNVQAWDADLDALAANATSGLWARTGAGTGSARTLQQPAAGITITNPAGTAGDPTLALANDLAALEGLSGTGLAARTGTDTWAQRTVTGTANEVTVSNGSGAAGDPTLSLPSALTFTGKTVTGGTFSGPATTGALDIQQALQLSGDISPAQITSNQNNYSPTGIGTASRVRIDTDASRDITGLDASSNTDGRVIIISNVGANSAVLKDENTNSTAANRFSFGTDITLGPKQAALFIYDTTASRWRYAGVPSTGGGGSTNPPTMQDFTTAGSNTWTKPTSPSTCTAVVIECVGGGGGGGGAAASGASNGAAGGGAGSGQYGFRRILCSSLSSTETVTVGAGGTGGNGNVTGNAGGSTSFGAQCTVTGGGGGTGSSTSTGGVESGGAGGSGGSGCTTTVGGVGSFGFNYNGVIALGGNGADGPWGGGGLGLKTGSGNTTGGAGSTGSGGGGAGGSDVNGSAGVGGAGGSGRCRVWEFY